MFIQPRYHDCRITEFSYKGHDVLCLENKFLRISVLLSKGADIMEFRYKPMDLDVLWHSPNDLPPLGNAIPTTPSPKYGSYLDHWYGGWQESLPSGVGCSTYKNAEFGIHGEVSLLPWDAQVLEDTAERISIKFIVRTRRSPFQLTRKMSLSKDDKFVSIEEELCNFGEEPMHYVWGHHPVFGEPFLESGCVMDFPGGTVHTPDSAYCDWTRYRPGQAAKWPDLMTVGNEAVRYDRAGAKELRTEDVSWISDISDGWFALRNPRREVGFFMAWDRAVFPYVWCWQAWGGSFNYPFYGRAYCWAVEPFSSPLATLSQNVERGEAMVLAPGEQVTTTLAAGIVTGAQSVTSCSNEGAVRRG